MTTNRHGTHSANVPVLEMEGITKEFWGSQVLYGVDFSLRRGEVHALVGQNGAGKSTLIKILSGAFSEYGGAIRIDGESVGLLDPRAAKAAGIATIYQDFTLIPQFTVAENIALGREPSARVPFAVDFNKLRSASAREAAALGIELPMSARAVELNVATQQLTEIVKAVSRRAKILIMDEPTARLSATERDRLFEIIHELTAKRVGVIYISHFLEEIFAVADRATVLRDGRVVSHTRVADLTLARLTELMTRGRLNTDSNLHRTALQGRRSAIRLEAFEVSGRVGPVDLNVAVGEVVGLAGLVGSGRTALARAIVGASKATAGRVITQIWSGRPRQPAEAASAGILLLTEDRKREGVIGVRSVGENIAITALVRGLSKFGFVRIGARKRLVSSMIERLGIVARGANAIASTLSGGNQQKLIFARAIAVNARVLILDQPTAGIDIGAKADLYQQISSLARDGVAIVLISDDLDELLILCDRIAVVSRGRVGEAIARESYDRASLLRAITVQGMSAVQQGAVAGQAAGGR